MGTNRQKEKNCFRKFLALFEVEQKAGKIRQQMV